MLVPGLNRVLRMKSAGIHTVCYITPPSHVVNSKYSYLLYCNIFYGICQVYIVSKVHSFLRFVFIHVKSSRVTSAALLDYTVAFLGASTFANSFSLETLYMWNTSLIILSISNPSVSDTHSPLYTS